MGNPDAVVNLHPAGRHETLAIGEFGQRINVDKNLAGDSHHKTEKCGFCFVFS
jgi:hypothetical protein